MFRRLFVCDALAGLLLQQQLNASLPQFGDLYVSHRSQIEDAADRAGRHRMSPGCTAEPAALGERQMALTFEMIRPNIGARVYIDRESLLEDATGPQCLDLLEKHQVLVFPRIGLSDAEQLAFTDMLGPRIDYTSTVAGGSAAAPNVYKLTLDPAVNDEPEETSATFFWHFDGYYLITPPPKATVLSGRKIPAEGARTDFANTYLAYDTLSPREKAEIAGLKAWHTTVGSMRQIKDGFDENALEKLRNTAKAMRATVDATGLPMLDPSCYDEYGTLLPLAWTHVDGRTSLLLGQNADRIEGLSLAVGRAILTRLQEWTVQPDFSYRHEWEEGDLVIWHNHGVIHRAHPYDGSSGRVMHRTTVSGTELFQ
jgi:alpha-ketoglutarate-dependent taurine dioxygenase